jgi:hypothetical protein
MISERQNGTRTRTGRVQLLAVMSVAYLYGQLMVTVRADICQITIKQITVSVEHQLGINQIKVVILILGTNEIPQYF